MTVLSNQPATDGFATDTPAAGARKGAPRKRLTLFDLDHTLIPVDSDYEWGEYTLAIGWCDSAEFKRQNAIFFDQYKAGTLDIHAYVRFATQAIRQQGATKSIAAHADFMRAVVQNVIKPAAL